jgi:hypothetical protein
MIEDSDHIYKFMYFHIYTAVRVPEDKTTHPPFSLAVLARISDIIIHGVEIFPLKLQVTNEWSVLFLNNTIIDYTTNSNCSL